MSNKSSRLNGKFRQDSILSQFRRDAKSKVSRESAVMQAKGNSKNLKEKVEEVRVSPLQISLNQIG